MGNRVEPTTTGMIVTYTLSYNNSTGQTCNAPGSGEAAPTATPTTFAGPDGDMTGYAFTHRSAGDTCQVYADITFNYNARDKELTDLKVIKWSQGYTSLTVNILQLQYTDSDGESVTEVTPTNASEAEKWTATITYNLCTYDHTTGTCV